MTTQPITCTCVNCPGPSCTCQRPASAPSSRCQCGESCRCGPGCDCQSA